MVKIMGELVDMEAVERRFVELSGGMLQAGAFAIVAVPHARREHALVAVFEKATMNAAECFERYQGQAAGIERLTGYLHMENLPRTALGKLKRGEIADFAVAR